MRIFLFNVNTIVGLDDWTDRKLISEVSSLVETENHLDLTLNLEDNLSLKRIIPGKSYALQFEHSNGEKELKYYSLRAFEVESPPRDSELYKIKLHTKKIEIGA